jgi:hypothetical protein
MFLDLHKKTSNLQGAKLADRIREAAEILPPVSIVAIGGIPILEVNGVFTLSGSVISPEVLRKNMLDLLGMSAALTYLNPKHREITNLGELCMDLNHTWAFHLSTVSILYCGAPSFVEKSFGRDGSFIPGSTWVETDEEGLPNIFTINGSLKDWKRYTAFRGDSTFKPVMRKWLGDTWVLLNSLYPDVFR